MKTNLQVSGQVELSHQEITLLIMTHLEEKYHYKVKKIVYETSGENSLKSAVCEIAGSTVQEEIETYKVKERIRRESPNHPVTKRNVGVYDTLRWLLTQCFKEAKKNGRDQGEIPFATLLEEVTTLHPGMDEQKLYVYLYDKRQLGTNYNFLPKERRVIVRSEINHIP